MAVSDSSETVSTKGEVFIGSYTALAQRFLGGILCTVAPAFLITGIVLVGVRWDLHAAIAICLLFICLFLLFLLEGTQIAVVRLKEGGHVSPRVYTQAPEVAALLEKMGEDGVAMYLIGRQVLVCANVYIVAALTELSSPILSRFCTIIAGILTVVCYGQLVPQLMADIDPIAFFDIWGVKFIIQISTLISRCGIGHFSYWLGTLWLSCFKSHAVADDVETPKLENDTYAQALGIFSGLHIEPHLTKTEKDHVPPHILLAVALGLGTGQAAEAHKLLEQLQGSNPENQVVKYLEKLSTVAGTQC